MHAYVLARVRSGEESGVVQMLRTVLAILTASFTFGPYDVVA